MLDCSLDELCPALLELAERARRDLGCSVEEAASFSPDQAVLVTFHVDGSDAWGESSSPSAVLLRRFLASAGAMEGAKGAFPVTQALGIAAYDLVLSAVGALDAMCWVGAPAPLPCRDELRTALVLWSPDDPSSSLRHSGSALEAARLV